MKLRRKLINEVKGSPMQQKALALALYLKKKINRRDSTIHNYNPNKIKMLTGISAPTFMRYLPLMIDNGYVTLQGKNKEHLVINKLASNDNGRNIIIDKFCFDNFTMVYRSLRAFVALMIQSRKDYVRRIIQAAANPKKTDNYKALRNKVKGLVKRGIIKSVHQAYKEFGISFKRFAKETGNCVRTAQNIIDFAISHSWITKHKNSKQFYVPRINKREIEGFTFATLNNLYIVEANTYTLSESLSDDLSHGSISW